MGEIVRALEGNLGLVDCVTDPEACAERDGCLARALWADLSRHLQERLDSMTLADLAAGELDSELTRALSEEPGPSDPA
jgi:DNA-binding IscR family transcriptional regulator